MVAGIPGDYALLEDLADIADWMTHAKRLPSYVEWDGEAAAEEQAEAAMRQNEALF